jgi:hypothetical protein
VHERYHLDEDSTKPYCDVQVVFVYPVSSSRVNVDTLQRSFVNSSCEWLREEFRRELPQRCRCI